MSLERWLRTISGIIVVISIFLSLVHSEAWLFITALAGLSLFQSGFSNWCPMMMFLRLIGIRQVCPLIFYEKKLENMKFRTPD
ncbi:MAG TPA: DUF2892 domain-containing protein [Thermodesulfovibrionia bacterium]|jgi:hypothetical protein|nr:DUF2892 domain-containing protein [Thermodesulfovibrionia bacterium]